MSIKGKGYIIGAYEHPTRHAPDKLVPQLMAEVALGALVDAGLSKEDIDGYFCGPWNGLSIDGRLSWAQTAAP